MTRSFRWNDPDSLDEYANFGSLTLPVPDEAVRKLAWCARHHDEHLGTPDCARAVSTPVVLAVLRDLAGRMVDVNDARTVRDVIEKLEASGE